MWSFLFVVLLLTAVLLLRKREIFVTQLRTHRTRTLAALVGFGFFSTYLIQSLDNGESVGQAIIWAIPVTVVGTAFILAVVGFRRRSTDG